MKTALALSPTHANFAPLYYAGDLALGLQKASEFGFDGVELNLRDSEELDQEWLLTQLGHLHLSVPSIGTGQSFFTDQLSLADPDPQVQAQVRQRMYGHVRFASRVGAMVVIGSVRGVLQGDSPQEKQRCYDTAVDAARDIARFASSSTIRLLIEPINRYETNFINNVTQALEFIEQVGEANIGVILDTFHMNIEEPSIFKSFQQAGERLWHVHLVDSNRYAPGMGHLDIPRIVQTIQEMGYDGYLSAEVVPVPDDETSAVRWMEAVRPLIQNTKTGAKREDRFI